MCLLDGGPVHLTRSAPFPGEEDSTWNCEAQLAEDGELVITVIAVCDPYNPPPEKCFGYRGVTHLGVPILEKS